MLEILQGRVFRRPTISPIAARFYGYRSAYGGATATLAVGADTHVAVPFFLDRPMVADRIQVNVTVAGASGKLLRLGLYSATLAGLPDALMLDSGAIASDTAAPFVASGTISQALAPFRLYYLTILCDSAITVTATTAGRSLYGNTGVDADGVRGALSKSATTYGALPASYGSHNAYTASPPNIVLRAV